MKQIEKTNTNIKKLSFYKRNLPENLIPFSSNEGKELFIKSMNSIYNSIYFILSQNFTTQTDPAFCGLSTLSMILNSLEVDPLQIWKYPWRWYVDDMLNCCRSLENIKQNGITIEEFSCLAKCNGLQSSFYRFNEISKEQFINDIKRSCSSNNEILVVSYDRKILGQTGSGHFSPIDLYNIENNMVLIFDVARFKYPLHWCSVDLLWDSFQTIDKATMKARGYILLKKDEKHNSCIKLILNKFDFKKILENINDISIYVNTIENYIELIYNILPDHEIIELNENNIKYNDKIIQNIKKTLLYENVSKIKKDEKEKEYFTIFLYSFNLFILENKLLNINIIKKLENLKEILDLDLEKEINIIKYKLYNLQNCCKYEICKFNDKFN